MFHCSWRTRHSEYIRENYLSEGMPYKDLIKHASGLMTYCQVAEFQGRVMPTSQRERNMINIIALGSAVQPLKTTLAILDKSQALGRNGLKTDGSVTPFATTSSMFALGLAHTLTTAEMAKLRGHNLEAFKLTDVSERQFRRMIGMSLHRGTAGWLMMGLLASLGCQS